MPRGRAQCSSPSFVLARISSPSSRNNVESKHNVTEKLFFFSLTLLDISAQSTGENLRLDCVKGCKWQHPSSAVSVTCCQCYSDTHRFLWGILWTHLGCEHSSVFFYLSGNGVFFSRYTSEMASAHSSDAVCSQEPRSLQFHKTKPFTFHHLIGTRRIQRFLEPNSLFFRTSVTIEQTIYWNHIFLLKGSNCIYIIIATEHRIMLHFSFYVNLVTPVVAYQPFCFL